MKLVPLMDFVPALSPRYARPDHLAPLIARLERAMVEPLRLVVSTPPRHAKTESILHAIPWHLLQRPDAQIAYVSYASGIAQRKSRKALALAKLAGVPLDRDALARGDWRTGVDDGGVLAFGIDGQVTGEGFHLMIVDDPTKNRSAAESSLERDKTFAPFLDDLYTRLEPTGSLIVCQARWHEDDLAGRLIRDGWESIRLPAIDSKDRALWPARFSLDRLREIEETLGPYGWSSLYQGEPIPRGGALFADAQTYADGDCPADLRIAIGVDFAYTAKTKSDHSVAVVLGTDGERYFIVDVVREQVAAPDFVGSLKKLAARFPRAPITAFVGGTERGVIDLIGTLGVTIDAKPATVDKFVRAQPVAAAWKARKVLVPARETAVWVTKFLDEVLGFTGVRDRHDDQVDALAAAFDALAEGVFAPGDIARSLARRRAAGSGRFEDGAQHHPGVALPPHEAAMLRKYGRYGSGRGL